MSFKVTAAALVLAGAGLLASGATAAPLAPASGPTSVTSGLPVEAVDFYYNRRRHCWYWDGWHGPGWYWCGYNLRRGYGWGGPAGWNRWESPRRRIYVEPRRFDRRY